MEILSSFCERAWVDYSFETCIGLPTYIVPLVNPHTVVKGRQITRTIQKKNFLTIMTLLPFDVTLSMFAYLFLSEIATLTPSSSLSAIFPYLHFCLTTGKVRWPSSIVVFACRRRLTVNTALG